MEYWERLGGSGKVNNAFLTAQGVDELCECHHSFLHTLKSIDVPVYKNVVFDFNTCYFRIFCMLGMFPIGYRRYRRLDEPSMSSPRLGI